MGWIWHRFLISPLSPLIVKFLTMLRRGTEFSKQKYHTGGIFRKFVVAGDGFISLCFIGCGFLRDAQTGAFQSPNPCTEPPLFGGSNPTQHTYLTKKHPQGMSFVKSWLRGMDLNHRPSGYEPDELPDCSTPR